jgi:fructose-1,6-bisphosphatase/inositol monophosphatase family enzyme
MPKRLTPKQFRNRIIIALIIDGIDFVTSFISLIPIVGTILGNIKDLIFDLFIQPVAGLLLWGSKGLFSGIEAILPSEIDAFIPTLFLTGLYLRYTKEI